MAELSDRMRALVQPHLAGIEPYDPSFTPCRINLSANENTYPLPATVRASVDAALAATPLTAEELRCVIGCDARSCLELLSELTVAGRVERLIDGRYAASAGALLERSLHGAQ